MAHFVCLRYDYTKFMAGTADLHLKLLGVQVSQDLT